MAAYGCGVKRAFAGGAVWDCPGSGIQKPAVQKIWIPTDAVGLVPAYALSDRAPVRSDDGGATWVSRGGAFGPAHDMAVGPGGRVWIYPVQEIPDGAPGDTLRSDDGGDTWHTVDGLSAVGDHPVAGVVDVGSFVAVFTADQDEGTSESLYISEDGDTFRQDYTSGSIADVALWPLGAAPACIVVVGPEGIEVRSDGGWTHRSDVPTRRVLCTRDGTLIAATRTQRLLRSTDGGESWSDIGAQLEGQVEALGANPAFNLHPEVVAMTPAGAFRVDADGRVSRWMGLQQADDQSHYAEFVDYQPATGDQSMPGARLGTVHALGVGGIATVWLRGTEVVILGAVVGEAEVELRVDGSATRATRTDLPLGGVLASAGGLPEGLHRVEVEVIAGDGVVIDAAQGVEASAPLGWGEPLAARGCGCEAHRSRGTVAAAVVGWLLLSCRRRSDIPCHRLKTG